MPRDESASVSKKLAPGGTGTPKKLRSCAAMISSPAPAVKPIDHRVRDEIDERAEARDAHPELHQADHQLERQHELDVASVPGAARAPSSRTPRATFALVGPETWCHDEPHSAPTIAGSIAP